MYSLDGVALLANVDWIVLASRWLHLAAVIVAVGGAIFMRLALLPGAKKALDDASHDRLREAVRVRWAPVVHVSIAVLLLTGMTNFYFLVLAKDVSPMPYHAVFGIKFLAAMFVFFVATGLVGRSPALESMRAARRQWLTVLVLVAGLILFLSGYLSQLRG